MSDPPDREAIRAELNAGDAARWAGRSLYFDQDCNPIGLGDWALLFEDFAGRQLALTQISPGVRVSTIWMGLDTSAGIGPPRMGPPLIFETALIVELDEPEETPFGEHTSEFPEMWRWSTREQALSGHEAIVQELRLGNEPAVEPDEHRL